MRGLRCVVDASVLIDLTRGGILEMLFRLEADWMISDLAIEELRDPSLETLLALGLRVMEFSGQDILKIISLGQEYPALSLPDRAHLALAERERAILLSGDRHLRVAAQALDVTVHGTLWLLDELVKAGLLLPSQATHALRQMLRQGSRLPKEACEKRLQRWEKA